MSERVVEIIREGRWATGDARGYVWVIRQDWDYYHEDFYDEGPDLSDDGWAYYALYGTDAKMKNHSSRSQTCFSETEAVERAEAAFESITWNSDD